MRKRTRFLPTFLTLLIISILIFILGSSGVLGGIRGGLENITIPIQRSVFGLAGTIRPDNDLKKLRDENLRLASLIVDQDKNEREIAALRAQFETSNPASFDLFAAQVIGRSGEFLIIDKGENDKLNRGDIVVFKNSLVGIVEKISAKVSTVKILTHESISFTAQTVDSKSIGIIKGQGVDMILENVILTDKLEDEEMVITKGDVDERGFGIVPGLIVGKIVSINRSESELFQTAEVESLIDFARLEIVFVMVSDYR